jgi:hypothetical protein
MSEWQEAGVQAVERLIQDTSGNELCLEYGARHLSVYRDLRDLLRRVREWRRAGAQSTAAQHEPSGDCWCQDCAHDFLADTRRLIDTLWEQHQAQRGPGTLRTMPFSFPGESASAPGPATPSPHDIATAELARGYDICVARAQEEWTSAQVDCADWNGDKPSLMEALGAHLANWCASFSPSPGVERRWGVYAMENDEAFTGWLAGLQPRRECHLKDALLMDLSPSDVVEKVILPCTGMFSGSPSGKGYTGEDVWPNSLLVCLTVWADYAGAEDAASTAGRGSFDVLAPAASALAMTRGPAADELKATVVTLYGAKLGLFRVPEQSCTAMWRSRGYDGAVHSSVAALALTRGLAFQGGGLSARCLDLCAAVMAVHDCIDCEADVMNRTACNLVLISAHKGHSIECVLDTVYATVAVNWTSTDVHGQLLLASISEQAGGSRWGGPVYAAESRSAVSGTRGNLWTDALSEERVTALRTANILPSTVDALSTIRQGASWHETVLGLSAQELLASPIGDADEPATPEEILALSKGTLALICCSSCAVCGQDRRLKLDSWAVPGDAATSTQIMLRVQRIRSNVDKPLQKLRTRLRSDSRPAAIYHLTAEAMMTGTLESRYLTALLEALITEDALYHGTDLLNYCAGWVQPPTRPGG